MLMRWRRRCHFEALDEALAAGRAEVGIAG